MFLKVLLPILLYIFQVVLCQEIPTSATGLQCQSPPVNVTNLFPSGTIISVSCPDEYDLVGASRTSCDFSGLWSTDGVGYCKYRKVRCQTPAIPPNSFIKDQTITGDEYLVGNYIQYGCGDGYDMVGNAIIRCSKGSGRSTIGRWSSPVPRCRRNNNPPPVVKSYCNAPRELPEYAFIESSTNANDDGTYGIGGTITYNCTFCYSLSGIQKIECLRGGIWSPDELPICIQTRFGYYLVNSTLVKCVEYRKLHQIVEIPD